MSLSRIVIGSLSVLTGGVLGTAVIYFYTKESMWEGGRNNFLPLNASKEDWKLVFEYFDINKKGNNITDEELKEIKSAQSLKNWCEDQYKKTFSSLFHSPNWMKLAEMKNACLLPIKKKLESSEKTLAKVKTDVDINKLKNHKDDNDQYKLTYRLKGIKNINDDKNIREYLFNWCREMADHGYQGEDSNVYKLVEGLCLKKNN